MSPKCWGWFHTDLHFSLLCFSGLPDVQKLHIFLHICFSAMLFTVAQLKSLHVNVQKSFSVEVKHDDTLGLHAHHANIHTVCMETLQTQINYGKGKGGQ